ncbi:hypothetical protein GCM10027417_24040 [Glutamicibacter endophyticus]
MARKIDLTGSDIARQRRGVRKYGTQTPMASTTVERGSTHWTAGSNVNIDGILGVDGTATVSGSLEVSGALSVSGPMSVSGQLDVTGPTTLDGDTTVGGQLDVTGPMSTDGTLEVKGVTTLSADLNVTASGKIIAGQTTIEPNGKATFGDVVIDPNTIYMIQAPGGNMVSGASDQISLSSSSTSSVSLDSARAELNHNGAAVRVETAQTTITNRLKVGNLPTAPAGSTPNLWVDSNGVLHRIP